jgi:hypothetical protein
MNASAFHVPQTQKKISKTLQKKLIKIFPAHHDEK